MYVLLALIILQTASPTVQPKHPIVQNGDRDAKTQTAQQQKQTDEPPSVAGSANKPSAPQTKTKAEDSQSDSDSGAYRVKIISQPELKDTKAFLIYVGLTAAAMIVNTAILLAIVRQNKINWRQVRINARAARAARASALAATRGAEATKKSADALINIERPWVMVTLRNGFAERFRHTKDGKAENIVYFSWFLTNLGKTAALVYEIVALFEVKTFEEVEEMRRAGPAGLPKLRPDAFIIGPGQTHECPGITMLTFWTDAQRKAVFDRSEFLVAHGAVRYRNTIDTTAIHETPFFGLYVYGEKFDEGEFRRFYDATGYNKYT